MKEELRAKKKQALEEKRAQHNETFKRARKVIREYFEILAREYKEEIAKEAKEKESGS